MKPTQKSKEIIENSWVKLESIFNNSSLRPATKLGIRYKKSIKGIKIRRNNYSVARSPDHSPELSAARTITPGLSFSRGISAVEGISKSQLKELYNAKCSDLSIPILPDQQFRFFSYCFKHFNKRKFEMQDSGLGEHSAKAVGEILTENNFFAYIILGKNSLGDVGGVLLVKLLQRNLNIVHLDISSNNITPEGSEEILKVLSMHGSLNSIDISSHEGLHRNRLSTLGASGLNLVLLRNIFIGYINVFGTSIGEGIQKIYSGLEKNSNLLYLNIGNNAIAGDFVEGLMQALQNSNLTELVICNNCIGNDGCNYIARFLAKGPMLQKLDISSNGITTKGCKGLFDSLRNNSKLKVLMMENNPLENGPSEEVIDFLVANYTLQVLSFNKCMLKNQGSLLIAEGIARNRSIVSLKLSTNAIGDSGMHGISLAMERNQTLISLDLSCNRIKDSGIAYLCNSLKKNFYLEEIYLNENIIKDEGGFNLCELVRTNANIIKLHLDLNEINSKQLSDIKSNLKKNLEKYTKTIPNKLKKDTEYTKSDDKAIQNIMQKIIQKKTEKQELKARIEKQYEKIEEIREIEAEKLKVLQENLLGLKERNKELSASLDELMSMIMRDRLKWEKEIKEMKDKIALIDIDIQKYEEISKGYLGDLLLLENGMYKNKTHSGTIRYVEALNAQEIIKQNTLNNLNLLKKKIADDRETVKNIKYLSTLKQEESKSSNREKSFLASEKLANTKKGYSDTSFSEFPKKKKGKK